ncbi:MAG: hypothetical protein R3321_02505 [Nitrososphaeraceae archaeon]|nr:hypothetical protein [Nitrososphaeraceae archaeon]
MSFYDIVKYKLGLFLKGFTDWKWHWMNWTDLINQTCAGEACINYIYDSDLEFNRRYFFDGICNKGGSI